MLIYTYSRTGPPVSKITKNNKKEKNDMKIRVIGKAHFLGTSKRTGKSYDFIQVHYNGPARDVVGLAAMTLSLDPAMVDYHNIMVPGDYNVEFDNRGYPVAFAPASGK